MLALYGNYWFIWLVWFPHTKYPDLSEFSIFWESWSSNGRLNLSLAANMKITIYASPIFSVCICYFVSSGKFVLSAGYSMVGHAHITCQYSQCHSSVISAFSLLCCLMTQFFIGSVEFCVQRASPLIICFILGISCIVPHMMHAWHQKNAPFGWDGLTSYWLFGYFSL